MGAGLGGCGGLRGALCRQGHLALDATPCGPTGTAPPQARGRSSSVAHTPQDLSPRSSWEPPRRRHRAIPSSPPPDGHLPWPRDPGANPLGPQSGPPETRAPGRPLGLGVVPGVPSKRPMCSPPPLPVTAGSGVSQHAPPQTPLAAAMENPDRGGAMLGAWGHRPHPSLSLQTLYGEGSTSWPTQQQAPLCEPPQRPLAASPARGASSGSGRWRRPGAWAQHGKDAGARCPAEAPALCQRPVPAALPSPTLAPAGRRRPPSGYSRHRGGRGEALQSDPFPGKL